jgi:hypothetical protein
MMLSSWANRGPNLWTVDLQTVSLVAGQATYNVLGSTVVLLDVYIETDNGSGSPIDRIIMPISRSEYAAYPNKEQQGFPTTYWFDRLISPTITIWPTPDGTAGQSLKYYRVRQIQDSNLQGGENVEIPYRWLEAFTSGLAARLALVWSPDKVVALKAFADEAYEAAASQDVETSNFYVAPQMSGYWRV